jgi:hypothetical protein
VVSLAPLRTIGPFLVLAAASLALDAAPEIPWAAGVAGAGLFVAAAVVRRAQVSAEQRTARRVADDRILHRQGVPVWREQELCSARARASRAKEVRRLVRAASADRLPSASPLNRSAVRTNAALLGRLTDRLADDRPVNARGMLYVDQLLRDPASPVYDERNLLLARAITRVLGALEQ